MIKSLGANMSVEEFSWGKAFSYALRYIAYAILWVIIGGVIMVAGMAMILSGYGPVPSSFEPPYYPPVFNLGAIIGGIILIIAGLIISILGSMAAYFKIMSRLIGEITSKPLPSPSRT